MRINEFIGQEQLIKDLTIHLSASIRSGDPLEHCMFYGGPGLGKTTMANIVADTLQANIIQKTGQEVQRKIIGPLLSEINNGDILFIDEIHAVPLKALELLYGPLQEINNLQMKKEMPNSFYHEGSVIEAFTLIGATTSAGMIAKPLRDRIILSYSFTPYSIKNLTNILAQKECPIEAAKEIAVRSRGVPRLALNYLVRIRNEVLQDEISKTDCVKMFKRLGVDANGFDQTDLMIMEYLHEYEIASEGETVKSLGIDLEDYRGMYEPYLLEKKMIRITPRGRVLTKLGQRYFEENK